MGLGVAGTYKDPNKRDKTNIISIEIEPNCNLACPNCITSNRRLAEKRFTRVDNFVNLLINYFPKDSVPIFIGLGEPTQPKAQAEIVNFLNNRSDIKKAHIQTNGSFKLEKDLIELIKDGRLSIGLSYDKMHRLGGQVHYAQLNIQPEYVSGIAIAIDGDEETIKGFNNHFKNLDRILIHPSINHNNEFVPTWNQLKQAISSYSKIYPEQMIYSDLSEFFRNTNQDFFKLVDKELTKTDEDWKFHEEIGFFVYAPSLNANGMRFLVDGKYTLKPEESVNKTWGDLEKETCSISTLSKHNS
jgi:organic radical activating enzyme